MMNVSNVESDKRCLNFSGLKVRFRTPSLSPKKTMTVPNNRDLISIPKESWGEEKPESDQDSSRIDGSSEGGSQIKQTEEDPERKESESG